MNRCASCSSIAIVLTLAHAAAADPEPAPVERVPAQPVTVTAAEQQPDFEPPAGGVHRSRPIETPDEEPPRSRSFSLTMSPLHLLMPMVELAAELRPTPHVGATVIVGAGSATDEMTNASAETLEIGGQVNIYANEFSGLHLGVEAIYLELNNISIDSTAAAGGFAVGPLVGYKWLTRSGFTFVGQLGGEYVLVHAKSSSKSVDERSLIPLLNLNVGWSF